MKRYCLTLDLKESADLIAEYDEWHKKVWPEILESIKDAGILNMEIYRFSNRLFMIVEGNESFSFEAKALKDTLNQKVQEWEELMWKYQRPLVTGKKWILMDKIFQLE